MGLQNVHNCKAITSSNIDGCCKTISVDIVSLFSAV